MSNTATVERLCCSCLVLLQGGVGTPDKSFFRSSFHVPYVNCKTSNRVVAKHCHLLNFSCYLLQCVIAYLCVNLVVELRLDHLTFAPSHCFFPNVHFHITSRIQRLTLRQPKLDPYPSCPDRASEGTSGLLSPLMRLCPSQ